jgi:hypothetical protein
MKLFDILISYSRDSDKVIFERLQKEFEAARAAQTEGTPCNTILGLCYLLILEVSLSVRMWI